nr:PREDICTED: uncharacterized protein LOC102355750 [Latimeria chalumnae]|eukprot:XP_005997279.2 PREDICTED: uncharacterized protein LOC102355750 [Latimeria chalumnae]
MAGLQFRYVPCATLLVRVVKAPKDKNHQTLERNKVPQTDWEKLGLFQPRPDYSDGIYYSETAQPTSGENCLYNAMVNRSVVLVREIVPLLAGDRAQELRTDEGISNWIRQKLTQMMDSKPLPFNMNYISRYLTSYGVKFSVDRAKNLPWSNLTLAHFSFNPPGAFYFGGPWIKYDRPVFTEKLDFGSHQRFPVWLDGFKSFPRRIYNEYLTVLVHLQEMGITTSVKETPRKGKTSKEKLNTGASPRENETFTYSLGDQAWTALNVFSKGYCNTDIYQLPLYQGAPNQDVLNALSRGECQRVLQELLHNNTIQLVRGASVFVRIADGRRDKELKTYGEKVIDQSQLPAAVIDTYNVEPSGATISQALPQGRPEEDKGKLIQHFKQLSQIQPEPLCHVPASSFPADEQNIWIKRMG